MPQASGSRHSMGYILESVYGTTPATPAFKYLRHNTTSLNLNKNAFQSNELRADRQIADFRHGTRSGAGNVVGELSYGTYDDFLEAALGGTWTTNVLKAGIVRRSFTIERNFQDVGQYFRYTGMEVDTLQLSMTPGAIIPITLGFMGQDMQVDDAIITGATYLAATTTSPMDALTGALEEGGVANGVITEVNINLANNLATRFVVGSPFTLEPSIGRSNVTGNITAFFETMDLYQKFLDEDESSIEVTAQAGVGGSSYAILLPRVKYSGGDVPVSGEGPVSISMPFQALLDPITGTNMQITRTP